MALYNFRDTTDTTPIKRAIPKEAMNFNGFFLENRIKGYRTISVGGRELFGNEPTIDTVGTRNGGKYRRSRLPIRTLVVTYNLQCATAEEFRSSYNQLNQLLMDHEVKVWFNDEPDKYYVATRAEVESVPQGMNSIVSSFNLVCADPYKYAMTEKVVDIDSQSFKVLSDPLNDTFSQRTQYAFNLSALPLNRAKNSSSKVSGDPTYGGLPAARFNTETIRAGEKYFIEFDMSFTGQASVIIKVGWATTGGSETGVLEDPQEIYVTQPTGQHVKFETTVTNTSGALYPTYVLIVDSANSTMTVTNFSITPTERQFWYPNTLDTFSGTLIDGTTISNTQYPFSQEMYDIINTDSQTLTFGENGGKLVVRVMHNIRDTFGDIFPEEMSNMTAAEQVSFVASMVGRIYQRAIIKGSGIIRFTNFNLPEPEPVDLIVGDKLMIGNSGRVAYNINFDAGLTQLGAIQVGAYAVTLTNGKTLVIDNQGTVPTAASFHVEHTSDNGYLSFQGSEGNGAIMVGNPAEIDGVNYEQNERLLFDSFETGKESTWTYGNAYILKGGSRGQLPVDRYLANTEAWNMIYNSNNFDEATGFAGVTLTKTTGQTIVNGSTTVTGATRIVSNGGSTNKFTLKKQNDPLYRQLKGKVYSTSLLVKNNDTANPVVCTLMGKATTVPAGGVALVKSENIGVNTDTTYFNCYFSISGSATAVDVTVAQLQLNYGATALPWRANYQDGFLLNNVNFAHNYVPFQWSSSNIIKFQSDKVLWNKKRSVAFVNSWRDIGLLLGTWSGIGMRRALPADSNGVLGAANFDSRFYCGSYQADVKHRGMLQFTLDDGTSRGSALPIATVMFWKGNANDYTNISFWIRDKEVYTIKDKKFNDFTGEVKIRKEGGKFTFYIRKGEQFGPTKTNNVSAQFVYTENAEASTLVKGMNVFFARSGTASEPPVNNFVHEVQLTKLNVDKYIDTPNVFASGDICDIISTEYLVQTFVNSVMNLEIQDVGSQPIMLPVGLSQVYLDYSDFADPTIKIQARYRERWL